MGNFQLHQQQDSSITGNDVFYVIYCSIARFVDDTIKEVIKMAEFKFALFLLTLIGIPAYICAWLIDIDTNLWKSIILGGIGAFTGIVIGLRYTIKLLTEWKEFRKKYYSKKYKS